MAHRTPNFAATGSRAIETTLVLRHGRCAPRSLLPVFSYLTLIYRELGRMTTGPVHEHLDIFEAEIEPKLK